MNTMYFCIIVCILLGSSLAQVQPPQPEAGPTLTLSAVIRDQAPNYMNHSAFPAHWWKWGWDNYPTRGSCGTANGGLGWPDTDFELPPWMWGDPRDPNATNGKGLADRGFLGDLCTSSNLDTCGKLGSDGTPMYRQLQANTTRSPGGTVQGPDSFNHWFHDTYKTIQIPYNFVLNRVDQSRVYNFQSTGFFPIDGQGWQDQGYGGGYHNFAFCVALHASFYYQGGEVFKFTGDDDMFVYIDRKLVIDLGGIHGAENANVDLDALGIWTKGKLLDFDLFYCERHTGQSTIQMSTSLGLLCADYDGCGVCGGNGQSCCKQDYCISQFEDRDLCYTYRCSQNSNATCTREPKTCTPTDKCSVTTCNPRTGACESKPRTDCNKGDKCMNYGCNNQTGCTASPKTCSSSSPCFNSQCDSTTGSCKQSLKRDCGESQSNKCVQNFCSNSTGTCDSINKLTSCPPKPCQTVSCDLATGNCVYANITCDDKLACTKDTCNPADNSCSNVPIVCPSTECSIGTCNNVTGQCDSRNLTCASGSCMTGRCQTPTNKCLTLRSNCDPSGTCTTIETNCTAPNPCEIGSCNTTTGACYTTPVYPNATCLACNGVACQQSTDPCKPVTCTNGQCVVSPVVCTAPDACATSQCQAVNGRATCVNSLITCSASLAADSCTPVVCDPKVGCVNTTSTCNDFNPCTVDTCTDNCTSVVPANVCDDNNVCTVDSCNSGANTTILAEACEHSNITCPPPDNACLVSLPCHAVNGCLYEERVCPQPADFCQVPYCERNAGCLSVPKACVVEDPDCYVGVCDSANSKCSQRERSNFATITSGKNGGKTCMFVYKRKTVAAITGGAAAGIAIGGAVALGLIGYGGKKGYDLWTAHQNTMSSGVSENPLYTPSENAGDNPLYGTDA